MTHNSDHALDPSLSKTCNLRLLVSTRDKLQAVLDSLNAKEFGHRVRIDDVLLLSITQLTDEHRHQLQVDTFSNADRLEIKFKEYQKDFPNVSKDEFLGILLK